MILLGNLKNVSFRETKVVLNFDLAFFFKSKWFLAVFFQILMIFFFLDYVSGSKNSCSLA